MILALTGVSGLGLLLLGVAFKPAFDEAVDDEARNMLHVAEAAIQQFESPVAGLDGDAPAAGDLNENDTVDNRRDRFALSQDADGGDIIARPLLRSGPADILDFGQGTSFHTLFGRTEGVGRSNHDLSTSSCVFWSEPSIANHFAAWLSPDTHKKTGPEASTFKVQFF